MVVKFSIHLKKETDLVGIEWLPFRIDRFSEGVCVWGGGGGGGRGGGLEHTGRHFVTMLKIYQAYQVLIHGTFKQ